MSRLQPLATFADIECGRVVRAGGDGVVVVVESGGREACRLGQRSSSVCEGIGAEFETMRKMGSENVSENDHFCKSEGRVQFFKMFIFPFILKSI